MSKYQARVSAIEKKLNLNKDEITIILLSFTDPVDKEYFKDEQEKESFLKWRVELLRQENTILNTGRKCLVYEYTDSDVQLYLPTFRLAYLTTIPQ